jgi:serine/threonine-protein kinase
MEQKLGRYTIEAPLGEGSFARVYRAFDEKLKRYVALKVLKPMWLDDPSAMRRFEHEATTMANLHHPHIAEIYDVDETEGQVYLAQFLVEGETLARRLTQGALSWTETLEILKGVAAALDYAHDQGIIHRDLKPPNILLTQDGGPYLSDFGLIRAAEGSVAVSSISGGMVGTPSYMAPEQWRGQEASPATDVYALSCVVVEMLTGKCLFDGPTPPAIMTKHVMDPPAFPAQWPPDVPVGVVEVLQRGLSKDPAERICRAGKLVAELEALGAATQLAVSAPAPALERPSPKKLLAGGTIALIGGVVVLLVILGMILFFVFGGGPGSDVTPVVVVTGTPTPTQEREDSSDVVDTTPGQTSTPTDEPTPKPTGVPVDTPTSTNTPQPPTNTPTPRPTPTATALPPTITAPDGATMILIPAGPFKMGSESGNGREKPVHEVTLDAFYIDQYEVTNVQYAACVDDGACVPPANSHSSTRVNYYGYSEYGHYPVIFVNWEQAKTYCEWRGARLPTEAEWEKAARGTDGRTYPWGEGIDCTLANYRSEDDVCMGDTTEVGSYPDGVSPYGVYDMAGNVNEWVQSEYRNYPYRPDDGRETLTRTDTRVLRGSSWYFDGDDARASYRVGSDPASQYEDIGFRCAGMVSAP